jgi:hypothetical protein
MILLQSIISGTSYQIKTLPKQSFEKTLTRSLEDMKITTSIADFAKFPLQTLFITDGYDFPEDDHLHIRKENVTAMYYGDDVFPLSGPESTPMVDFLIDYMIDHTEFGVDKAKEMAIKVIS